MRIDVMVDIETLGTDVDSTIFQIAAAAFDINTGQKLSYFNEKADISTNKSYEMVVSGETLKWWLNTDKELLTKILNGGYGTSSELLELFHKWLTGVGVLGDIHLWGNGILFDNNMLKTQMESNGLTYPIRYNKDRDVRTIVDLYCTKMNITENEFKLQHRNKYLTAHDAFDDVTGQINMVVSCHKELTGSDENEK